MVGAMGMMIDGRWTTQWYGGDSEGHFVREPTRFRDWISNDGSSHFKPEAERYHLYISRACPWAHRAALMRQLKGLEDAVGLSIVHPYMGEDGWSFDVEDDDTTGDRVFESKFLRDIYLRADARYTGRVTVPVLWDTRSNTIVSNESRDIIRMLDDLFEEQAAPGAPTYHPFHLHDRIESTLDAIYEPINNGVYRAGFAKSQNAYEQAVHDLFEALDHWEHVLTQQPFLCGDVVTEADWCLFTTLYRFDPVYHVHFKCNLKRICDYPNLWNYLKQLYQVPNVSATCNLHHVKRHYYQSHPMVNPTGLVAAGPLDYALDAPHDRGRFRAAQG